ncbi:benzene dioxygenase small subunit [Caenibius tardaugens NBRC 16725]|uniref:Benzene dioxygenase small subunit n=1 Tax=Caenibius tardaugens NBRC 16725 TaxID=1219035 RepID=U2YNS7_9SPHN|nr:aromatic-ring-hydroxylating dioxygenase subunit beta [Caenibius tardaugens]AZI35394.1 3-phenylpropionate/cinnamic acid dioxygenase subunit beta [Caenibius tardaugens NBRC 16725]GAD50520.1 benzene dioxygenase small subunit [Caenibius tardaugens NBRC 16725]
MPQNDAITLNALALQHRVERFYYDEAALLDDRCYNDWLTLFAKDIRYVMPLRTNRTRREWKLEFSGPHESAYFDEDYASLDMRVRKFASGTNWAEDPPSRTRHLIGNVRIVDDNAGEITVRSAFIVYRNRLERQTEVFAGEREDLLRADGATFRIARRHIALDQGTLLTSSLSFFF